MRQKTTAWVMDFKDYFFIVGSGLFSIYKKVFQKVLSRLGLFSAGEILYYLLAMVATVFVGIGWRSYDIIINEQVNHHSIATNDFLVYLTGFFILFLPALVKFFLVREIPLVNQWSFVSGLLLISVFYVLTLFNPSRISPMPESEFTPGFYLFGFFVFLLWIAGVWIRGVPGIKSMPSTHSRN